MHYRVYIVFLDAHVGGQRALDWIIGVIQDPSLAHLDCAMCRISQRYLAGSRCQAGLAPRAANLFAEPNGSPKDSGCVRWGWGPSLWEAPWEAFIIVD